MVGLLMNDTVLRLLIVDDNPDDREMLRRMLASFKSRFQIIEAETGTAALKVCLENPPDCVLLDYHLPDYEAPDFLAELGGSEWPWCPVVVITGLIDGLNGSEMIRQGAQDFIGKSWINQESLQRAVENAIERYKMFRSLHDKEQLLSASQRNAHIGSWACYRNGHIEWSDETYRIWGVSPDTFTPTPQSLENLVYPEDRPLLKAFIAACLSGKSPPEIVTRRLMPDGNLRYLCGQAELNSNPRLKNLLLEGTVQDVTEHTLAQIKLKDREERLSLALDAARLGIFDWDMILNRIVWSRRQEALYGFKPGEFDGSYAHFASRVHADDLQGLEDEVVRCIATHDHFKQQYRVVHLDGTELWLSVVAEIYFDAAGQPRRMTGTVEDITERKRSEALLLEVEATRIAANYARNLIETHLDPLVTLSLEGKITDANAAAEAVFECAKSDLLGSDFAGYFVKPDAAIELYQQVFKTGMAYNHALDIRRAKGQATPVLYNATLYRDNFGVVLGAVAVARDITDLVIIEKALKKSESRFKAIFNKAPLGIAIVNSLTGQLLSINPMFAKIVGKTMAEIVTINWMSITYPDDVQKNLDNMVLINAGKIPGFTMEKRYLNPDGTITWINLTVTPIDESDKSSPRHLAMIEDISSRKLNEDIILNESKKNRALLNAASDGIHILDEDGKLIEFSASFGDMLGFSPEETAKLKVSDWDAQIQTEQLPVKIQTLLKQPEVFETRHRRKDGSFIDVEINAKGIELSGKRYLYASSRDITERKYNENQLRENEQQLLNILDVSPIAVRITSDKGGEVMFYNHCYSNLIGNSNPLGINPEHYYASIEDYHDILETLARDKVVLNRTVKIRNPDDGTICWVLTSYMTIQYKGEAAVLGWFYDMTSEYNATNTLIKAKELAEETTRIKSEFLANMSHEIRTPMNGVLGMLDLLSETELSSLQQNWLRTAHSSAEALLEIINDILDLSKLEADRIDIESVNFNLVELIDDVCALLALRAHDKGLELNCGLPANLVSVWQGDPQGIRQVLTNLIGNAIKFTEHGEVSLGVMLLPESPHLLHFEIRDTGIGISEANQSRLFKSFSQAESSISRRFGGTGLGLFISKKLVELMGGTMGVDSVAGQGSCFWFNLPLKQSEAQPAGAPKYDLSGKRALIVDDNATNRHILSHYLNHWGLTVGEADNSTTALIELQTSASHGSTYDVIVLDRQMPVMDGLTLAKCLAQIPGLASLPIILLSSTNQLELAEYQNTHIVERLLKTVRQTQLFEALVNALQGVAPKKVKAALTKFDRPNYQGKKVLVVEDNKTNQKVIIANLEKFNIVSELAENGQQALATLEEHGYDLIFMDCHMPVLDGYSATRELRLLEASLGLPHQTVIALTANALSDEREKCLVAGMDDYLSKPLVTSQLTALLAKYFDADSPQVVVNDTGVLITGDLRIWDETTTLLHLQDDKTLLLKIISVFLMESATQLNDLSHLYATGDLQALADTAHALKGGAALFYAAPVVECAQRLEDSARTGQAADYQSLIDALDKAATTLINTLQAYAQPQFL